MDWYDRAEIYDVWTAWDPGPERALVLAASVRHGRGRPGAVLEPFCGTGRLLRTMPGRAVGFDRNANMLRYAAARGARVFRADAARFAVRPRSFDAAFALVDSFRHLLDEAQARAHLRAVARALRPGGVYVLGLDVTGDLPGGDRSVQRWASSRDGWTVEGSVTCLGDADPERRVETLHVALEARRGARHERIESFQPLRTYARRELEDLVDGEASFEIAAVLDHRLDLDRPCELSEVEGSAVLVLRAEPYPSGS